MNSRLYRPLLTLTALAGVFVSGCDPKLTGAEGGTGDVGDTQNAVVTPDALSVGTIAAFHVDLMTQFLSQSAAFDSTVVAFRSLSTGCVDVNLTASDPLAYSVSVSGCVDGNGTTYAGGGQLSSLTTQPDGYTFLPSFSDDLIRAINTEDESFNHTIDQGSLALDFERSSGVVNGIQVDKFFRHLVRGDALTLSFVDVHFSGTHGSWPSYPDTGGLLRVVWDGVGILDIAIENNLLTWTQAAVPYQVNLDTGIVSVGNLLSQ